ncbi:MAG: IPT/TIG domain-containing protein, partial [Chlorobi bacterium]|nr:IPT/TIG domain-containing protein [Chlorobiota bacterium]
MMKSKITSSLLIFMLLFPPLFMTSCSDNTEDKTEKKTYPTTIDSISHSAPAIGDTVTVSGKNFGKERHGCYFVFETEDGNIEVEEEAYLKWSDTEVIFVVPESANDGNLFINNRVSSALVVEV